MTTRLPLTEASADEIVSRTVAQIVLRDYKLNPHCYDTPATRLYDLSFQWREAGLFLIAEQLMNVANHVASGGTVASWRTLHTGLALARHQALRRLGQSRRR
jgi:hypothetical protein